MNMDELINEALESIYELHSTMDNLYVFTNIVMRFQEKLDTVDGFDARQTQALSEMMGYLSQIKSNAEYIMIDADELAGDLADRM